MVTVKKICDVQGFIELKPVWNKLVEESDINKIFLTHEWIHAWWEAFGKHHRLYLLTVHEDDDIIGLAPLMLTGDPENTQRNGIIQFIGTPNADYNDFIGRNKRAVIEHIFAYLKAHRKEWARIELSQIPDNSGTLKTVEELAGKYFKHYRRQEIEEVAFFKYEGSEEKQMEFKLRKGSTFKRNQNFFKSAKGLTVEQLHHPDKIKEQLPFLFQSHITRWKFLKQPSKFENPEVCNYHYLLVEKLAPLNRISFALLKHGDEPLAYLFAFDYDKNIHLYNIANESFYQRRSPGIIIIHLLMDLIIPEGYHTIDFSRGAGSHKDRFANHTAMNFQFTVYGNKLEYLLSGLYKRIKNTAPIKMLINNRLLSDFRKKMTAYFSSQYQGRIIEAIINLAKSAISLIVSHKCFLLFLSEHDTEYDVQPKNDYIVKRLNSEDIEKIANFYGILENSDKHIVIKERFNREADCFAAFSKDQVISIAWGIYHKEKDFKTGLELMPKENQVIYFDEFTAEQFQGSDMADHLLSYVVGYYRGKNIDLLVAVAVSKKDRRQFVQKMKCKQIGKVRLLKILGLEL